MYLLTNILKRIDYKIFPNAFSRPQTQIKLLLEELFLIVNNKKFSNLLDIGGGPRPPYNNLLKRFVNKYLNLDIKNGVGIDIVGSVYKIPLRSDSFDLVTMFMVLEHLYEPIIALKECNRILSNSGYLLITTVQYWHEHNHPSDYFRYTRHGLSYLLNKAGFKIIKIWPHGGPFLLLFHMIEINLMESMRPLFSIIFFRIFDLLDWIVFKHNDQRENPDTFGWSLIAVKK